MATNYLKDANVRAAYLFNKDESPITDNSGNGRSLTLAAAGNPDFVDGKNLGGYKFDTNGGLDGGTSLSLNGTGNFTICGWFKGNNAGNLIAQRDSGGYLGAYRVQIVSGKLRFRIYGTENADQFSVSGGEILSTTTFKQ